MRWIGRIFWSSWGFAVPAVLAGTALVLTACGGGQSGTQAPPPPPSITLSTLVPGYAVAGTGSTSVFVNGSGFT
ncbi:MAG TPA: hypothetical protein VGN39_02680, partial [Terriglobales bacterium]|nr:hypothetical protein [Terriglobales bacterium]